MHKALLPLRHFAVSVGKRLAPQAYSRLKFRSMGRNFPEPELYLLPYLCDSRKTSLDIGASQGLYTAHLLSLSRCCIAFEPRPKQAADLKLALRQFKNNVSVEAVALSDRTGEARLRILADDPGRSTIEESNLLEDEDGSSFTELTTSIRRLDDYALDNVGFVKIDVEGHELSVLKGGEQTIRKSHPSLLVEIEDRHRRNAIFDVTDYLAGLGYSGFFLLNRVAHPLSKFDIALHQDSRNIGGWKSHWQRRGIYINNFIFVPTEKRQDFIHSVLLCKW
jgi:FkbM family methyltransferase